jgi:L-ribulose-5-phosphate 4-epimerase
MALHTVMLAAEAERIDDDLLRRHYERKHGATAYYGQT